MKQRFSAFDVKCIVAELQKYVGMRVANIYDLNAKTYLFKLAKPEDKVFLVIESGIRVHTTGFMREKNVMPSQFSMKMRKHIRTRRLTEVRQLGIDRVIDFRFGEGDSAYHIFVEFYAAGNIVLTDHEFTILSLLRTVAPNEDVKFAVREQYSMQLVRNFAPISQEALLKVLSEAKPDENLKKVLNTSFDYGPAIVDHCCLLAGLKSSMKVSDIKLFADSPQILAILSAFHEGDKLIQSQEETKKGYIILKVTPKTASSEALKLYEEFHPVLLKQFENAEILEFPSFNEAVDTFFSSLEEQKQELKAHQQETQALKKMEAIRTDHENRLKSLEEAKDVNIRKAQLIEENLELVDAALSIIRSFLARSMPWDEIKEAVEEEKKAGHPVAKAIHQLKFETNQITMLLSDWLEDDSDFSEEESSDDEEEEEEPAEKPKKKGGKSQPPQKGKEAQKKSPQKPKKIDVDLSLSAFANATRYYDNMRSSASKFQKTVDASKKALVSAEKKIQKEIHQVKVTATITKLRKPYWFEKFLWFVSSENYLVIGGRDMQQNEMLVKRYMRKGDVYVHAEIHGAATIVVKNPSGEPISPITLAQAGAMAVCQSSAWDAKVVTSAWWVHHDQVSKTAPTGEYLTTGSFMIRGKKNFLPPTQLIMGFGLLFRLDDTCIAKHIGERRVKIDTADIQGDMTGISVDHEKYGLKVEEFVRQNKPEQLQTKDKTRAEGMKDAPSTASNEPGPSNPPFAEASDDEDDIELKVSSDSEGEEDRKPSEAPEGDEGGQGQGPETGADADEPAEGNEDNGGDHPEDDGDSDDEDEDEGSSLFPDTSVDANVQRTISSTSSLTLNPAPDREVKGASGSADSEAQKGRYITAAERRMMKKAAQKGIPLEDLQQQKKEQPQPQGKPPMPQGKPPMPQGKPPMPQQKGKADQQVTQTQAPRGKKGKIKKMKDKYADQDEEDREMMMELLGSAKPSAKQLQEQQRLKEKEARLAKQQQQQQQQQGKKGGQPKQGQKGTQQKNEPEEAAQEPEEAAAQPPEGDSQEPPKQGKGRAEARANKKKEEEELKQLLAEENIMDDEELATLSVLDTLTGKPLADDTLLFAIPVCAPYSALTNYKYKVKLTPGTAKKGKAVQTALNLWTHLDEVTQREKDLMKSIPDPEMIAAMMGKVKISTPNLEKVKAATKKKGK